MGEPEPLPISRILAIRALHAGAGAAGQGRLVTHCPYAFTGSLEQQFATHWWVKGWRRAQSYPSDATWTGSDAATSCSKRSSWGG